MPRFHRKGGFRSESRGEGEEFGGEEWGWRWECQWLGYLRSALWAVDRAHVLCLPDRAESDAGRFSVLFVYGFGIVFATCIV